jgi:hypothetical protein
VKFVYLNPLDAAAALASMSILQLAQDRSAGQHDARRPA